ncbi:hypothetical protein CC1G_03201 [Coprinopsis cinerea okayama7|uniref:BSD domain-containing protein n=1 Tax=Coprinopsis cinerea (strain Okayama-7 / 130 / ATCC MYA-4618 / FGSC 9003) TaxID=240176 RepID=A8N758_COPC7|nr:hypothetical protein CC1G_03201 [Coprinopsis cinerea okayama7\|eukprot:XP_001830664.1 hypothetical protein CC1G_03201 [Coprinopsis cinerea okayama7\
MPTTVCTAKASYKKLPGLLELTDTHLQWTQDGKKQPAIRVAHAEAASLFSSKEGAEQVRLKIVLVNNPNGHTFAFTNQPQSVAYQERERFKTELTTIIARNKANADLPQSTPAGSAPQTPTPNGIPRPQTARPSAVPSRAQSVSSDRATPTIVANDPAADFRLRKRVLTSNPDLAQLHQELVMTGQMSEAEFWDGREHLLLAQQAVENQRKGKPGTLVDPRPETVDGGEIKIIITKQLIADIFDEYPVVAKAYNENVPNNLTEEQFWQRYFQSKLFNSHRASIRSSATQHVVKDDAIFDQYLEDPDDGIEPRRQRDERPEIFLDLGATHADHGEPTVEKDITMQAGKQKGAIPLIRKFNEHSERLLNSALGDISPSKRRRLDNGEAYSQIEIEDLRGSEVSDGIVLDMQDRQRYFEGTIGNQQKDSSLKLNPVETKREARLALVDWEKGLNQLKIERKGGDSALISMTQNVAARLDVRSRKNDIPDGLFRQMITCQTAANEFLRQYWSSTFPPPSDQLPGLAVPTPAQRATKAQKMIGYLGKTHEKVHALVQVAQQHGIDGSKIENASTLLFLDVLHC